MSIFKIMGLLIIFLSCTYLGVYKSNSLSKRSKSLNELCISFDKLSVLIKDGTGELEGLIAASFGKNVVISDGKPILTAEGLTAEDMELFIKFYSELGISQREKEYKRVTLYKNLFEKQRKGAEENSGKLCKLYNSLGLLLGLSVCIFLI